MAEQIQQLSGGVRVDYTISGSKEVRIDVYDSDGFLLTSVSSGARDVNSNISFCIDAAISNINSDIRDYTAAITTLNTQVAAQQKIYDDPASTSVQKQAALTQIQTLQGQIVDKNVQIKEANVAITGINSKGKSILTGLIPAPETPPVKPTPAPTPVPTQAPAAAPTKAKLAGAADGDSGTKQANPAGSTGAPPHQPPATSTAPVGKPADTTSSESNATAPAPPPAPDPDTESEEIGRVSTQQIANSSPGKRLKNPLGDFSSYTYQLSLYMITPDAYEAFVASGRKKIDIFSDLTAGSDAGGAFLVAQSGGINNTSSKRAPGFKFDYGIDNLQIVQRISGKSTQSSTNIQELKFTITEPYGFSFLDNLKRAGDVIAEYSGGIGKTPQNPARNFFILGIRFFGYDASGRLVSESNASAFDPGSIDGSLFEHFYDITIATLKFKIDGKSVTYNIDAKVTANAAFSVKRGMIDNPITLTANTVGEMISGLFKKLNKDQEDLAKGTPPNVMYPNKYDLVYLPGAEIIKDASIVSKADLDKSKWAGSGAKTTAESTPATEVKTTTPKDNFRTMTFAAGGSILDAINQIITQSQYLEKALSVVYTTDIQSDPTKKDNNQIPVDTPRTISWYNAAAEITGLKWDELTADWAYTMRYLIQVYETPVVDSVYSDANKYYPGPHKRYEYWYTGKNSEILQYDHTLDNMFYNTVVSAATTPAFTGTKTDTPSIPGKFTSQPRLGKTGLGMEAQNNYLTALNDPNAFAKAKISILGDPDFLIQEPTSSVNAVYDKYYGGTGGFTVNANGGQVFIEIDFKEAIDYDSSGTSPGTMSINDSIQFWKYPENLSNLSKKIKGVSYMVNTCTSTFMNGSFKQTLEANINDFGKGKDEAAAKETAAREADTKPAGKLNNPTGPSKSNPTATTASTGTKSDPAFSTSKPVTTNTKNAPSASKPTSATGPSSKPVADDDGG